MDLSRALSDVQSSPPAEQITHLSRLMASEAYRRAWAEYRAGSPAWQRRDGSLGQLEPLLHRVAEAGPVAIYSVDENFFPLAEWLKQSMRDNLDELNRVADRLVSAEGELDARMAVAAEIQKPEFTASVAGPAGAFLGRRDHPGARPRRLPGGAGRRAARLLRRLRKGRGQEGQRADAPRQGDSRAAGGAAVPK